ncbi:protein FAM162A-like isoform X2 [Rhinatrema bivittatum]|uniref:protein FAM162A-like isoform X2 n=1 Tax=Rhinatrema bivittatum TaxID=194408 RepID=UPI00112E3055|nr:protein FAM162A-like isoform X2 [Rhinatrema bivittatum]
MLGSSLKCRTLASRILKGATSQAWQESTGPLNMLRTRRIFCSKSNGIKDKEVASQTAFSGYKPFRNERRPTPLDKKILLWAGRFRKEEDIPAFVSLEVINAATNKVRIKICYVMIAITLLGCVAMVIAGKNAARRDDNLLKMNMEKKAKWKTEAGKEDDSVALKQQ